MVSRRARAICRQATLLMTWRAGSAEMVLSTPKRERTRSIELSTYFSLLRYTGHPAAKTGWTKPNLYEKSDPDLAAAAAWSILRMWPLEWMLTS